MADNETKSESQSETQSEETKSESTQSSGEKSPESLLESVRSGFAPMAATADEMPVEITPFREALGAYIEPTVWATPVDPIDGGDGSHATPELKEEDYVWKPFVAPDSWPMEEDFNSDGTIWNDTPATQTQVAANNTATVAGNSLTKF